MLEAFLLPLLLRSTPAFRCLKWSVTRAVAISVVVWACCKRMAPLYCCAAVTGGTLPVLYINESHETKT